MLVEWRSSNEFDFWGLEGVLVVESEVQSELLPCVERVLRPRKLNMPDVLGLINNIKLKQSLVLLIDGFSFFL